ncbi:hypothetical protein SCHPADRAFT_510358 [Schizopora paradoxa]|uniref:MYND-type domain-containing protein n=1 Tax=Schizopora paradoxa TaxID=27342 RepID=A0A0H2RGA7_9AGAM|nr:hypothetical protein SCHPADRAFT_510358 [Schizopora paradoxa]
MNGVSIFTIDQAKRSILAILGTACFVCQKVPDELLRCQQCKRLSYCSDACKSSDLASHEKICLPLQRAPLSTPSHKRRMVFGRGDTPYDLEPEVFLLFAEEEKVFMQMVGDDYSRAHRDLLLYEPRCAVCLKSADDMRNLYDSTYTSLLHCPDCRAAFVCSEDHRAEYRDEHYKSLEDGKLTECELNQRAYEDSVEIITQGWTKSETLWFPMRRKIEYSPLPSSWDEWFADPINICPSDSSPVLNRIRTKQLSIPLTILYGMELFDKAAGDLPSLSSRIELEIAVIGAMEYELHYGGLAYFEEILHSLPRLRRLTLRFIGPQVNRGLVKPDGKNQEVLKWVPCALCHEKGIQFVHSIHAVLFHDYVKKGTAVAAEDGGPAFKWPDLAVVFNSGMGLNHYKRSDWSPTLEVLAENGVPTLCTSFLEREAEEDENYLTNHRCNIVIKRHKNPWRSEVLTKMVLMRKHFFTYNGFVQGFRGLVEGKGARPGLLIDEEKMLDILQQLVLATQIYGVGKS